MKIIAVSSFKRGTSKSFLCANLAYTLAAMGQRVGLIDLAFQFPSLDVYFSANLEQFEPDTLFKVKLRKYNFNLFDLTHTFTEKPRGSLHLLVPDTSKFGDAFDIREIKKKLDSISEISQWDFAILDTSSTLNDDLFLILALANRVLVTLRPDHQDIIGTLHLLQFLKKLVVGKLGLVITQTLVEEIPPVELKELEKSFNIPIDAILPFSEDALAMSSRGIFTELNPLSAIASRLEELANRLVNAD